MFISKKAVSPVIAIVLLLMMTVAAAGAAYFWITSMQSSMQESSRKSIENIMEASGRRVVAQATLCKPTYPYKGLVGYWMMDEGSGDYANDSSKYENDGTLEDLNTTNADGDTPPQWTSGKVGQALDYDGSDDMTNLSEPIELEDQNLEPDLSVTAWVKLDGIAVGHRQAIIGHASDDTNDNFGFYEDGGDLGTYVDGTNVTTTFYVDGSQGTSLSADIWHFVAVSVEVDDLADASGTPWGIGKYGDHIDGWVWPFGGAIDEVRVYDRALSQEEINKIYKKGKMKVKVTVRNIGSVEIPEAKFVANLKKDGTTVDSDTYVTKSSIDTGDLKTLTFHFNEMRPDGSYNVNIPGIDVSQTVKCQSLE